MHGYDLAREAVDAFDANDAARAEYSRKEWEFENEVWQVRVFAAPCDDLMKAAKGLVKARHTRNTALSRHEMAMYRLKLWVRAHEDAISEAREVAESFHDYEEARIELQRAERQFTEARQFVRLETEDEDYTGEGIARNAQRLARRRYACDQAFRRYHTAIYELRLWARVHGKED